MRNIELTWPDIWQNGQRSVKKKVAENLSRLDFNGMKKVYMRWLIIKFLYGHEAVQMN